MPVWCDSSLPSPPVLGNQHCNFLSIGLSFLTWRSDCNPSTLEAKRGRLQIWSHHGLPNENQAKLGRIVRPGLKITKKKAIVFSDYFTESSSLVISYTWQCPYLLLFLVLQIETRAYILDKCYTLKLPPQPNLWSFVIGFFTEHNRIHPCWSMCLTCCLLMVK